MKIEIRSVTYYSTEFIIKNYGKYLKQYEVKDNKVFATFNNIRDIIKFSRDIGHNLIIHTDGSIRVYDGYFE